MPEATVYMRLHTGGTEKAFKVKRLHMRITKHRTAPGETGVIYNVFDLEAVPVESLPEWAHPHTASQEGTTFDFYHPSPARPASGGMKD